MRSRALARAVVLAIAASLTIAGMASADSLVADGDALVPGPQPTVDLGAVAPGAEVEVPLRFVLTCAGTSHLDPGQTVTVSPFGATVPPGGAATVDGLSFTTPGGWPTDDEDCASPAETWVTPATTAHLTAPSEAGGPFAYDLLFWVTSPAGLAGIGQFVEAHVVLTVAIAQPPADEPPVLELPSDLTVVTDDPTGAVVDFTARATDAEDDADPSVVCAPPSGSWFPVGTTTVACSAEDSAGQVVSGTLEVTVRYDSPVSVAFEAPIPRGLRVVLAAGRTLPVKAHLERAGRPVLDGSVDLVPSACGAAVRVAPTALTLAGGRWLGSLRLAALEGCGRVDLRLDGRVVGGFDLVAAAPPAGRLAVP